MSIPNLIFGELLSLSSLTSTSYNYCGNILYTDSIWLFSPLQVSERTEMCRTLSSFYQSNSSKFRNIKLSQLVLDSSIKISKRLENYFEVNERNPQHSQSFGSDWLVFNRYWLPKKVNGNYVWNFMPGVTTSNNDILHWHPYWCAGVPDDIAVGLHQ